MDGVRLSLSCGYYDRTLAVLDGRVKPKGIELLLPPLQPGVTMGSPVADVYETALPALIIQRERANTHRGLPIFPRRKFFHQLLLCRNEAPIHRFEDFAGKKIGLLRWYQHALGVWLRGYLKHRYGIEPESMEWFTERPDLHPPRGMAARIHLLSGQEDLAQMLAEGGLDILIHERAHAFLIERPALRRIFPDSKEREISYFRETGMFPINHVLAIRKEIAQNHPWVAASLVSAFEEAKRITLDALDGDNSLVSSPWVSYLLEEQYRDLRRDMFLYGLEANRKELEAHVLYLYEQGFISEIMPLEEIFVSETVRLN